jgi:hypothetical protein
MLRGAVSRSLLCSINYPDMGITDQHYALIIIPLFITLASTCFGTYVPSSRSVLYPDEIL